MAYGDLPLDAPLKPNKGLEGGACNRQSCQAEPALWYNHGMDKWYCADCARDIGEDHINKMGWVLSEHYPGHPQFETREMMDEREAKDIERDQADNAKIYGKKADFIIYDDIPPFHGLRGPRQKPQSPSLQRLLRKTKRVKL